MPAGNAHLDDVMSALARSDKLLITSHSRPDGDAVGSVLALGMVLRQMGKSVTLALSDGVPELYRWLPGSGEIDQRQTIEESYDVVVLLECDSVERTGLRGLESRFLINIDHHASGRNFADLNWIDTSAAAVAEMVYRIARASGVRITPEMAASLYCAVLTDTGAFCYEGTNPHIFELATDLVRRGANPVAIARNIYFSSPISKVKLLGAALSGLQCEDSICWVSITEADMQRVNAQEEDCEGIVNYAISIAGMDVAVFFRELPGGEVRASLRSKTGINVAFIAESFGGGGHETASGCTLEGPLAVAVSRMLAKLRQALAEFRKQGGIAAAPGSAGPHTDRKRPPSDESGWPAE